MISKWAEGVTPRGFCWIITDRLGVCERPGGYGQDHRRVRRLEEIIWLRRNQFHKVITITTAPYNLIDYEQQGLPYVHLPFSDATAGSERLEQIFTAIHKGVSVGPVLVHHESIGDPVLGVVAGYLLWAGLVDSGPQAITITEQLLERRSGPSARRVVTMARQIKSVQ